VQTNEPEEFRFSSRVAAIIGLTMVAMIPPLVGVALALHGYLHPQNSHSSSDEGAQQLRKAFEEVADKTMAPASMGLPEWEIDVQNPSVTVAALEKSLQSAAGVSFRAAENSQEIRLSVQASLSWAQSLKQSFSDGRWTRPLQEPVADESRVLFEILIKKKGQ